MEALFQSGKFFKSGSGELCPELGYSVAAWDGLDPPRAASLRIHAGAYTDRNSQPNWIDVEGFNIKNTSLVDSGVLRRVLLAIAESWNADWGVVETWSYQCQTLDDAGFPLRPWGGWLTYLSAMYADIVVPPPEIHAERLPNGGLYMLGIAWPS